MNLRIVSIKFVGFSKVLAKLASLAKVGPKIVLILWASASVAASTPTTQNFSASLEHGLKPLCKEIFLPPISLSLSKPPTRATTLSTTETPNEATTEFVQMSAAIPLQNKTPLTPSALAASLRKTLNNSSDVDRFQFLPLSGFNQSGKATQGPENQASTQTPGYFLEFQHQNNYQGKKLSIYVDASTKNPEILVSSNERRLVLPGDFDPDLLPSEIRKLLIGQPLHPYNSGALATTANYLKLKEVQGVALQALQNFLVSNKNNHLDASKRKILFVGPGGVGKTTIYLQALEWQLQQGTPGLHILIADTTGHLNQMHKAVERLLESNPQTPAQLIKWGDGSPSTPAHVLGQQTKDRQWGGGSTVLVTTIQSLRQKVITEAEAQEIIPILKSIIYDESHHAGAEMAKNLIAQLIDAQDSKALLIGTTATPIHRESEISALFGGNTHWFYLDQASKDEIPLSAIIDQLALAIQAGDITPFYRFHFLNRKNLGIPAEGELFVPEAGTQNLRRVLNPKFYPQVFSKIGGLFKKQKKIVLMAGTIAGAERILKFLTFHFPEISTQSLHSDSKDSDVIFDDFKNGQYRILVTVNKFDEALDDPEIDTVIDLSASASPRQLVQRLARPARLSIGKEEVTAVLFLEANEDSIREQIALIEAVLQRRLQGNIHHHDQLTTAPPGDLSKLQKHPTTEAEFFDDEALILASYLEIQATLVDFWNQSQLSGKHTTQERTAELINFIDKRLAAGKKRLLPSKSAMNPEEKALGNWLKNRKDQSPENWHTGLPAHQIEALKKLNLLQVRNRTPTQDRLAELIVFIDRRISEGNQGLLPWGKSKNKDERILGNWVDNRKKSFRENWFIGLPQHQIEALDRLGLLKVRKSKPSKDSLAELSAFIEERLKENAPKLLPNPYSKNEMERRLGGWVKGRRSLSGTTWYVGLPEHQIQALEKQGLLKVRTQKKTIERMTELVAFIEERLKEGSRLSLPSTHSKNEDERSLGVWLNFRKSKLKEKWYLGLPDHQIQALEKAGLLQINSILLLRPRFDP